MEADAFERLVSLGPPACARELRTDPERLELFLSSLLERCFPCDAEHGGSLPPNICGVPFSTWVMWLATSPAPDGETPEEYMKRAQESYGAKSNVCGRIWGKGYVAYRCRTCGMSPCSAICHECFEKGKHRTHNFLMYRSVAGGCCDCGDPGAWKASGFCANHKGPTEAFHLPMPEEELRSAYVTAHKLAAHISTALTLHYENVKAESEDGNQVRMPEGYTALLELLQRLCVGGEVYRRIVCAAVLEDIGLANPSLRPALMEEKSQRHALLESLVRAGTHLSIEMSTLFLQMLFDFDFKREFTRCFIKLYRHFMSTILKLQEHKEIPTRMVDISVQLFSNSMLTVKMIREERLLSTLFSNVLSLCDAQAANDVEQSIQCEHPVWTKRTYWPITNDMVNILSHRAVVIEFLMDPQLVREWLVVAQRFQAMDTHVRQQEVHIEIENRQWTSPFFIELELVMEQLGLLETGLKDSLIPDGDTGVPPVDPRALMASMREILDMGVQRLAEWLRSPAAAIGRVEAGPYVPAPYFVQAQAVTLHIPVHRFVAFFLSQLCRLVGADLLRAVFPSRDFVLAMMEHPLRIQVLLAQIRAGIWRWNGETMLRRAWFYRSSYFYDFGFDLDLFSLQCAAVLLSPDTFLLTLLHRFNLVSLFGFTPPRHADRDGYPPEAPWAHIPAPFVPTIAEDFLVLLGAIVSERARLGYTDRECMRQEVIARLCVRPHAHSQLTDNICRRWHEHEEFEAVLYEVADYEPPKSDRMEQGKYKLKKELAEWQANSLIHILIRSFNHGDYEAALEQAKSEAARANSTAGGAPRTLPMLPPAEGLFKRLALLLKSRVLHQVLHRVLLHALERREYSSSVQLHVSLWLLRAALEQYAEGAKGGGGEAAEACVWPDAEDDLPRAWGCVMTGGDIVQSMQETVEVGGGLPQREDGGGGGAGGQGEGEGGEGGARQREPQSIKGMLQAMLKSDVFADVHSFIAQVLGLLKEVSEFGSAVSPKVESQGESLVQGSVGQDAKSKARERQAALLASFAAQQKEFADAMLTDADSDDEDMHERRHQSVECVICSVSSRPCVDNPMGLVCLVQRSRLLASSHDKAMHHMHAAPPDDDPAHTHAHVPGGAAWGDGGGAGSADLVRGANLHFQSCGHHIHLSCFASYFESLVQNERHHRNVQREQPRIDLTRGLFLCPMCRQIANVLVPLLPDDRQGGCASPAPQEPPAARPPEAAAASGGGMGGAAGGMGQEAPEQAAERTMAAAVGQLVELSGADGFLGAGEGGGEGEAWVCAGDGLMEGELQVFAKVMMRLGREEQGAVGVGDAGEYLRVLVNSLGMTIGCVELSARDPIVGALRVEEAVSAAQHRVLNVAYNVSRIALHERCRWRGATAARGAAEVVGLISSLSGRGLGDALPPSSSSSSAVAAAAGPVPLLLRDMYSLLNRLLYVLPAHLAHEHRYTLLRLVFLGCVVQATMVFHLKARRREGGDEMLDGEEGEGGGSTSHDWLEGEEGELRDLLRGLVGGLRRPELSTFFVFDPKVLWMWGEGGGGAGRDLGNRLADCVRTCTHSFLRKAALAYHVRFGDQLTAHRLGSVCGRAEWEQLAANAGISCDAHTALPLVGQAGIGLIARWTQELASYAQRGLRSEDLSACLPAPVTDGFPLMVPLPDLYHDLYMRHRDQRCKFCCTVPHRPALCLMCGELACFASECCRRTNVPWASDSGPVSECFAHAVECGCGTGAFMLLKTSMVLLIRETHWCIWGSPYLDTYGEEDPELKRGRPLHLNKERYQQLQLLHSTMGFDHNSRVASSWQTGAQRY